MGKSSAKITFKALLLGLAAFALALPTLTPHFSGFELKAFDLCSRKFNPATKTEDIVIVTVDQDSLDALATEGITWPWPRQVYAPIIEYFSQAEAVYVDILFTESSSYGNDDDLILGESIRKAGNVTLPIFLTDTKPEPSREDRPFLDRVALTGTVPRSQAHKSVLAPILPLAGAARDGGNVAIFGDPDGVYRRIPLFYRGGTYLFPQFVLGDLLARGLLARTPSGVITRRGEELPLVDGGLLLRFSKAEKPFLTIRAVDIIRAVSGAEPNPAYTRDFFRGKRVFLGLTAAGLFDYKPTAVSDRSAGVTIHATLLDNILRGTFFRPVAIPWPLALMLMLSLATARFILSHTAVGANLAFLAIAGGVAAGIPAALFAYGRYMPLTPPAISLLLSFLLAAAYSYATEGRERRFVRRAFSQYMDETLVAHLLEHPDLIQPGGQKKRVTVFFADIAGFTTIAERFPAEETAHMLHEVLNALSEEVIRNHGVIDKYIGDCIMAFWGAPLPDGRDEANACRAAISCLDALATVNRRFREEGLGEIGMRIGMHTGDAIVGNLGSDRLFDYTVIGDTVNLASRLESANKFFHTRIMASEETIGETGDLFLTRELGRIAVKGKEQPVRIFEILGTREAAQPEMREIAERHGRGMALFHERRWEEAKNIFAALLSDYPSDGPAALYRDWCERLHENPPLTDDWDVVKMTGK